MVVPNEARQDGARPKQPDDASAKQRLQPPCKCNAAAAFQSHRRIRSVQFALYSVSRLARRAQIRQDPLKAAKALDGIFIGNRTGDDDILTLLPVGGRCHLMLGRQLN